MWIVDPQTHDFMESGLFPYLFEALIFDFVCFMRDGAIFDS
jgi:hypothetical protein